MQNQKAIALFKKYREGYCTTEELTLLENWYLNHTHKSYDHNQRLLTHLYHKKIERLNSCNLTNHLYTTTRTKIFEEIALHQPESEYINSLAQFIDTLDIEK